MTRVVVQHVATADQVLVVTRHRQDIPPGEPASLIAEDRLIPGQRSEIVFHAGEIVTLHVEPEAGHGKA